MTLFDNATSVIIDNKEVVSIITSDGGVIYQKQVSDNYALSLTSNKNELSYNDSESCTLSATLTNNNVAVSGETVTFKAYKGNTLVATIGSASTNNNGVATISYTSQGTGNITIKAEVNERNLVSTYDIEDCVVSKAEVGSYNTSSNENINIPITSDFKIEYTIRHIPNQEDAELLLIDENWSNMFEVIVNQYQKSISWDLNGGRVEYSSENLFTGNMPLVVKIEFTEDTITCYLYGNEIGSISLEDYAYDFDSWKILTIVDGSPLYYFKCKLL